MRPETIIFALSLLLVSTAAAFGQDSVAVSEPGTTQIVVPYGQWIETLSSSLRDVIITIAVAGLAFAGRSLPYYLQWIIKSRAAQQWLEKAVDRGLNAVVGATKGQELRFAVGSEVAAKAAQYMVSEAPKWLVEWLGGFDGIRERVLSRLPLQADASVPIAATHVKRVTKVSQMPRHKDHSSGGH